MLRLIRNRVDSSLVETIGRKTRRDVRNIAWNTQQLQGEEVLKKERGTTPLVSASLCLMNPLATFHKFEYNIVQVWFVNSTTMLKEKCLFSFVNFCMDAHILFVEIVSTSLLNMMSNIFIHQKS